MKDERILILGGTGFLGKHLTEAFKRRNIKFTVAGNYHGEWQKDAWVSCGINLTNPYAFPAYLDWYGPFDYVFHLAGYNGGIGFNEQNPFSIFASNSLMACNVMQACAAAKVKKVVSVVASCGYPHDMEGVYREDTYLEGSPHDTVSCHGYAKRNLQLASYYASKQYGLSAVCVCPTTLYGPGDTFDLQRTKVVGALVKRFVDAKKSGTDVTIWGTGKVLREIMYVKDCAELLIKVAEPYNDSSMPLNLGSGQELAIADLAALIGKLVGFEGKINFDLTKPDGQYRKRLDLTRMRGIVGNYEFTELETGLSETIDYYCEEVDD